MAHQLHSIGFHAQSLYRLRHPGFAAVAREKISFLVASLSLIAFVVGNMVGQHGWYAFWRSVLGKENVVIAFDGTVNPIEKVPDYLRWKTYGGSPELNSFKTVPSDLLVPLPPYDPQKIGPQSDGSLTSAVYSVGHLGSYTTGGDQDGSHAGVDIRVPKGTPVLSIANGVVEKVVVQNYGFGNHILIRHPNVPDPDHPGMTTTIYSTYAHLDAVLVSQGQVVHRGQNIGLSGQSGEASGPHLHFQIDRDSAPFHPYWTFSSQDLRDAGLSFSQGVSSTIGLERGRQHTMSPLLFVEAYKGVTYQSIASATTREPIRETLSPAARRQQRIGSRQARATQERALRAAAPVVEPAPAVAVQDTTPRQQQSRETASLVVEHAGKSTGSWQSVRVRAVDRFGSTVKNPSIPGTVYVISEFGEASVRPAELTAKDFVDGVAEVQVLARGPKTVILGLRGGFVATSAPLVYAR